MAALVAFRLTCAGAGVGVGLKSENRKIEEKKRPSAVIKAILGTINSFECGT